MDLAGDRPRLTAVLGPTNTGKTHLAIERMLGHASGMIGFPLRLLARENYDRIVAIKGRAHVALVTGEEKIVPPGARWFLCTVESMPLDRPVAFLGIDEIQLCADPERGHVFTDRLLHARGNAETMVMGAETIRPLIRKLVPEAEFVTRPRFSELTHTGMRKLTRLPPRSAIVVFSANDVYEIAELMRRQRGGTAVVLGALSPRTRNAQVGLYQSGEVDYLVATDAIGMGLNMDIDHVAFARLTKFDGRFPRRLRATEIAQIAGRAGRHMANGTFGTTDEAGTLDEELVDRVQNHRFDPLQMVMWRNGDLDFRSALGLLRSLERRPTRPELRRMAEADDQLSLSLLMRDEELVGRARNPAAVRLLWEVCQIPDFRKVLSDAHIRMQGQIFRQLTTGLAGRLDTDWVAEQVEKLDRTEGDIDALVARIAHVRTWTYIAHRGSWIADSGHWQETTRAVEDRLSDALHERLTQRFVDRRTALLVRSMKAGGELLAAVNAKGEVLVEGEHVGSIEGFAFYPDATIEDDDLKAIRSAARRALKDEVAGRVGKLEAAPDEDLALAADGVISWRGTGIGRIAAGPSPLAPVARVRDTDLLDGAGRDRVAARLTRFLADHVAQELRPLLRLREAALTGAARGIAFQLVEGLGLQPRRTLDGLIHALTAADRKQLSGLGMRFGPSHVYLAPMLKPRPTGLRVLLGAVAAGRPLPAALPAPARISVLAEAGQDAAALDLAGFVPCGPRRIRLDRIDALRDAAESRRRQGGLTADPALAPIVGCTVAEIPAILQAAGYRPTQDDEGRVTYVPVRTKRPQAPRPAAASADSPFAKLALLRRHNG
ncbi:disulfide oxidoreductase [Mycobacterium sp. KBS0706]|uniref:helicase-related protein n=1 Tax=Mycobacterium sp. KBS0706 TaxID=2578109 RepID=UPI00110FA26C|nr:helicase-related protein [Mycobacterium sp. KBS0706]TSD88184.1 disulfide oxidoreductase [Mycobacterium sp. KBS0706]